MALLGSRSLSKSETIKFRGISSHKERDYA
jgi:hypothetical protein